MWKGKNRKKDPNRGSFPRDPEVWESLGQNLSSPEAAVATERGQRPLWPTLCPADPHWDSGQTSPRERSSGSTHQYAFLVLCARSLFFAWLLLSPSFPRETPRLSSSFLFTNHYIIFHTNNRRPTFAPLCICVVPIFLFSINLVKFLLLPGKRQAQF